MNSRIIVRFLSFSLTLGAALTATTVRADDIDLFTGASAGASEAPNVIFLIDNSPNWSRNAQHWPDNSGNQGQAELAAISSLLNTINASNRANVGLALLSEYTGPAGGGNTPGNGGGYMRFGVRDMTVAGNRTALQSILAAVSASINSPAEKLSGMPKKEETAGLYEVYKYLSGLAPFSGPYLQNPLADVANNPNNSTAAKNGLNSGFAIGANGLYVSPITSATSCARTYIVYIANNANNSGSTGRAAFQAAVATAAPALVPTVGEDNWTPEWTKFLFQTGIVVPGGNTNGSVVTYVLDAYSAQQNVPYSSALANAAKMGGGKYFQVGTQAAIFAAITTIFEEIQAVNSTFASASVPVNSTNRTQNDNQVFIPLFRPDPDGKPQWKGNLKRYQLIADNLGNVSLGGNSSPAVSAINTLTGFQTACATSFWTTDSGTYWSNVSEYPIPRGTCPTSPYSMWSDAPDGPIVEKGGVAEVIRKGNNPPTTNTTPTWAVNRTVYTQSGASLVTFNAANTGLPASLVNFMRGQDTSDENGNTNTTESRASLHGDEVHSKPVAVDYGGATGITVYYGSNDGTLRAVDTATGRELWAFIPPEFYTPAPVVPPATPTGFSRLMNNSPLIAYPNTPAGINPTPVAKDYYFDGSIGLYQNSNSSNVWIYPTMRRGGRMLYAFDVTNPSSPQFLWKAGCPNKANDTGCTTGMSGIGLTWSVPMPAYSIVGYNRPVVVVGGGYDACDDANSASPSCGSPKGAAVYVLDAQNGSLVKSFTTTRSVAADVALIGVASTGVVDHAYAADTGGNLYRIDFTANQANWGITRIAYTNGAGRKFLFPPALAIAPGGRLYVALGSGDREHPLQSQYPFGSVVNRFYVLLDDVSSGTTVNLDDSTVMDDRTLPADCSTNQVLPGSEKKGWFMDLNQYGQGEQTVTSALIAAGLVTFSTNRPIPAALGSCSTALGEAHGYWVNLFNGSGAIGVTGQSCGGVRSSIFVGGGLPPSPIFAAVPINGTVQAVVIGAAQLSGAASSPIAPQKVDPSIVPVRRRIFWHGSGEN